MITEEEAARIMAIVNHNSFDGTTWSENYVARLDEAFGGRSYTFGQSVPFWQAAAWRATKEMWGVTGLIRFLAALRGSVFAHRRALERLGAVWKR